MVRCQAAVANPFVAYGAILALQLRLIWNIWQSKDLETADGSQYFFFATSWTHGLHHDIAWSPLYTDYWGTILALLGDDVYAAAIVQRILIVLAASVLVLALMRALLGPPVGLLVAVWWTILPTNYNPLFEVHLFAVLPILVAALVLARGPRRGALGAALGVLAVSALLLRAELLIATAIVAVAVVVREFRERRVNPVAISAYVRAYGIPLIIVCLLAGGAYWRSFDQGNNIRIELNDKHTRNLCQVYAFYYKQRYPGRFPGNPFSDCLPLMQREFGRPLPSFLQATVANPGAIAALVGWNTRLLVSGVQVSLFDATSTGDNPDFRAVRTHRSYALILSAIVLALVGAGFGVMKRQFEFWREWLAVRAWALIVLGAVGINAIVVAWAERPRPEYMYGLTVGLLALIGFCAVVLLRRVGGMVHAAVVAAALTVLLIALLPSHYHPASRPLHDAVERLEVVRGQLRQPGSVLVTSAYNAEICGYLAESVFRYCTAPSWAALASQVSPRRSICDVLDQTKATVIYADPSLYADPALARLLASPQSAGWRQVAVGTATEGQWSVLIRLSSRDHPITRHSSTSSCRRS
jgi:hypothetical protein